MTTSLQDIVDPLAESSDGVSLINTDLLKAIDQRVLWLATRMIHEANVIRPNTENTKVGGHQASSASVVSMASSR